MSLPDLRLTTAIIAGQAAGFASRALGRGGGTTLPGVVARRINPDTLRQLSARLPGGVVVVAGTNGKTTTTRMLAALLQAAGQQVLHNRAGANLLSGLTATALAAATPGGRVRATIGLFETDEAALPAALDETRPRLVLLHNLFRDQLDRYGEVDTIATHWRAALERLPASSTVLLNADDPAVAALGAGLTAQVRYYGLQDTRHAVAAASHIADSQFCQRCGTAYQYSARFYAHIGHYSCPNCGLARPTPDIRLERLDLLGTAAAQLIIAVPGAQRGGNLAPLYFQLYLPLPGLYNALNALAAIAAGLLLELPPAGIRTTLATFSAAFGRIERIDAAGKPLLLALIKNPVGASETLRMLVGGDGRRKTEDGGRRTDGGQIDSEESSTVQPQDIAAQPIHLLIAINDRHADGTDVSWLWDADFEQLAGQVAAVTVSGTRASDMALRLKYAGVAAELLDVQPDLPTALDAALAGLPGGAVLYAVPTYTAMLELRAELVRRGWARPFWED